MGELNTFPVSYKVSGKRIVIVGDGEEALNKARLAIKTTASVVIVPTGISSKDMQDVGIEIAQKYETAVLENAALVFIAAEGEIAERAKADARAFGIPVNVVDVPDECDFFTPSITDRAPLSIAAATEGHAP